MNANEGSQFSLSSATESSGGGSSLKFIFIGVAAAVSGTFLEWSQQVDSANVFVSALIRTVIVLVPAAITYFLLSREQEKKLAQVSATIEKAARSLADLSRVADIEKNYYASDCLLSIERRVIDETVASMRDVAELVAEIGDESPLEVRLKERFRLHAKAVVTLHQAFAAELEQKFKAIHRVENEFKVLPHAQREELVYAASKAQTERVSQRINLPQAVRNLAQLTERSHEMGQLADEKHREIVGRLDSALDKGNHSDAK